MRHTLVAKIVAAGVVVIATGTARAQDGDDGAFKTLPIAQIATTTGLVRTISRPGTASEFSPLPSPWLPPPHPTTPSNSHNSRTRQIWAGVALGLMGLIGGTSIGQAMDRQCGCHDPGMQGGLIGGPVGAGVGATFGVWLGGR
jgi:hypothetical protein